LIRSRDKSVSIETRLRAGLPGFNSRQGQWWDFSLRHRVQAGCGGQSASYPVGTGCSLLGRKRSGREGDQSSPSSREDKNAWSYSSIPLHGMVLSYEQGLRIFNSTLLSGSVRLVVFVNVGYVFDSREQNTN
jgi:hypothetical protein